MSALVALSGLLRAATGADRPNIVVILLDVARVGILHGDDRQVAPWPAARHTAIEAGFDRSLNLQAGGVYFHNQTGIKGGAKLVLTGVEKPLNDMIV